MPRVDHDLRRLLDSDDPALDKDLKRLALATALWLLFLVLVVLAFAVWAPR